MNSARALEAKSGEAALGDPPVIADDDELVILRADYFENYAGRYLSVEAKDRLGGAAPSGSTYIGPAVSVSWNTGAGTPIDQGPRPMNINIDPDTTPDTYIEHRILIRIGNIGEGAGAPTKIRLGSSTGASLEGDVSMWLGTGVPPAVPGYLSDFTTRYMDPTEVRARFFAAGRRVLEPRRARDAAVQDERLSAQGAGQHGRLDDAGRDADGSG